MSKLIPKIILFFVYFLLISAIFYQRSYFKERSRLLTQGGYYIGCIHGSNNVITNYVADSVQKTCEQMAKSEDMGKIIKLVDAMNKGKKK